jgi:hypothetical protein
MGRAPILIFLPYLYTHSRQTVTEIPYLVKRRLRLEMSSEQRAETPSVVDAILQICVFALTSYPVISPLLSQLRQELRETFERVIEVLPRLSQALGEVQVDSRLTEQFTNQLLENVPELERFFRRLRD